MESYPIETSYARIVLENAYGQVSVWTLMRQVKSGDRSRDVDPEDRQPCLTRMLGIVAFLLGGLSVAEAGAQGIEVVLTTTPLGKELQLIARGSRDFAEQLWSPTATAIITHEGATYPFAVYDASYLKLAFREGLSLATLDTAMAAAAKLSKLPIWESS